MPAPTRRSRSQTPKSRLGRIADNHWHGTSPRPLRKRKFLIGLSQDSGKARSPASLAWRNKLLTAISSHAGHLVTLREPGAGSTIFRSTKRRAHRRDQNRQKSQYCNGDAPWSVRSNWTPRVHPDLLTLPRCKCVVNNALLCGSQSCSFFQNFSPGGETPHQRGKIWWGWGDSNSRQTV
jgi:hypothetical protein